MGRKETEKSLDLYTYVPSVDGDIMFIAEAPSPSREFNPGEHARWSAFRTPTGVIAINLVHRDHPDAMCQVQCVLDEQCWNMFLYHQSPTSDFIPDETAEALAQWVMAILEEGSAD